MQYNKSPHNHLGVCADQQAGRLGNLVRQPRLVHARVAGPLRALLRSALCSWFVLGLQACSSDHTAGAGATAGSGASSPASSGSAGMAVGGAGSGSVGSAGADAGGAASGAGAGGGAGSGASVGVSGAAGTGGVASGGMNAGGAGGRDLSTDRSRFLGASRCAQANVQLCEDFESGTLDPNTWTAIGSTKPVIDDVQKARGTKALHLTITGNGQSAIRESKTFPATNNTYYGRVFAYFASLPTATGMSYSHWTMIAASGTQVGGEIRVSGQLQDGVNLWGVGTDSTASGTGTGDWTNADADPNGSPLAVPTGQWLCIEWLHKGDTNETRFWWDGVEHPSLYTKPSTPHGGNEGVQYILPQFQQVWLGWQEYQASTTKFELWLDEIAIDKDRIGCVI
ncbi:MAG: hypothetical protein ABI488_02075 [Polyangiaceae bacterium]